MALLCPIARYDVDEEGEALADQNDLVQETHQVYKVQKRSGGRRERNKVDKGACWVMQMQMQKDLYHSGIPRKKLTLNQMLC